MEEQVSELDVVRGATVPGAIDYIVLGVHGVPIGIAGVSPVLGGYLSALHRGFIG